MKKRYSIGFFAATLLCLVVLTMAYQLSYTKEEYDAKKEIKEESVAAEGHAKKADLFYLKELDGYVAVYRSDGETIFEYTSISMDTLPKEVEEEIRQVKVIRSEELLYGFLENYSS